MGFRTTMMANDCALEISDAFLEKYPFLMARKNDNGKIFLPVASAYEIKFYDTFATTDVFVDLQKLVIEQEIGKVIIVLLHECGGITKVHIDAKRIVGMEPEEWKMVDGVTHNYCYGCSNPLDSIDPKNLK